MTWNDKTVLITGGSRGLGFALAEELGTRGAKLALVASHGARLEHATRALLGRGTRAVAIRADVGEKQAIHRIIGQTQALLGPIDVLIHNASTLGPTPLRGLLDTECEDFARVLEVNLLGPFRLSRAVAAGMLVRGSGLIAHISSDAAREAYPHWGAYGVSKAALDHLSKSWAAELSQTSVRVLSIDPGEMDTDMHRAALPDADPLTLRKPQAVARGIVRIVENTAAFPSGTRAHIEEVQ